MKSTGKRTALYARVSTDSQTTDNQLRELRAAAERHGWVIVAEFVDHGISGAKGRDKRPQFDALLHGVARKQFDMIAAWSVDRLGRSHAGPTRVPDGTPRERRRTVPSSTGTRHVYACRQGDVSDVRSVRRV